MQNIPSGAEKLPPELVKGINEKQLQFLHETIHSEMDLGSPDQRKYAMQLRLLKKLNAKEYEKSQTDKRHNPRFS